MEIHVWQAGGTTVQELGNFKAFKVVAHGFTSAAELRQRLGELGRADDDGEHVFVAVPWLDRCAGAAAEPEDWRRRLSEMAELAARHGWADTEGRIRAHVEQAAT